MTPADAPRRESTAALRQAILAAADAIDAARDELTRLDSIAGDGDHGLTMSHGARSVRQALEANPDADAASLLEKVAIAMGSVGGAIGPIYAMSLLDVAAVVRTAASDATALSVLHRSAEAALTAIGGLGSAKEGDKTIIDALAPLARSLAESDASGQSLDAALARARDAARAGADGTAAMIARLGRAARLGEQSRGSPDAGATSFAILVEAAVGSFVGRQPAHG